MKGWKLLITALVLATYCAADSALAAPANHDRQIASLVGYICSDGGQWLRCYSLDPSNCNALMKEVVTPCATGAFKTMKAKSSPEGTTGVALKLMQCMNNSFMAKYLNGKVDTAECRTMPSHLQ